MRHFPVRECGYAIGFVVLLAAIYVGSYYAMVERELIDATPKDIVVSGSWRAYVPSYRFGGEWAWQIFKPLHELDRRLRPEWWDVDYFRFSTRR
jgi:hypothetical protein